MGRGRRIFLACAALAAVGGACGSYGEEDTPKAPAAPGPDAQAEASSDDEGCKRARPPGPPAQDDAPTVKRAYWFAMDSLAFPLALPGAQHPGLDLDDSCTCQRDERDGAAPCDTPASVRTVCDFDGGVDDGVATSLGQFFKQYAGLDPAGFTTARLREGGATLLVYLSDYNGTANDPEVSVAFVRSGGMFSKEGCVGQAPRTLTASADDAGHPPTYAPLYDGCDRWSPAPGLLINSYPDRKPLLVAPAYVVDGTLVAKLTEVPFPLAAGGVRFTSVSAVAKISPEGTGFRLDGIIAGRVKFEELVRFIGSIGTGPARTPACETAFWAGISPSLCSARDTMLSPNDQFQNKVCDAVTMNSGFSARAATVADNESAGASSTACASTVVHCN